MKAEIGDYINVAKLNGGTDQWTKVLSIEEGYYEDEEVYFSANGYYVSSVLLGLDDVKLESEIM